jgi:hypothetical protein
MGDTAREEFDMKIANRESGVEARVSAVPLGVGSWAILIVLVLLLAVTFVIVYLGWTWEIALTCQRQGMSPWRSA